MLVVFGSDKIPVVITTFPVEAVMFPVCAVNPVPAVTNPEKEGEPVAIGAAPVPIIVDPVAIGPSDAISLFAAPYRTAFITG